MSTVPQSDALETKLSFALAYIGRGWPVFVLGEGKTPVKNCPRCDRQSSTYVLHDEESCGCLMCHGFYAATLEPRYVREMLRHRPHGHLAVRTGGLSRLLVVDAEGHADPNAEDGVTGLDVLDDWAGWTNFELSPTLRQRTPSGGLHLLYRLHPEEVVRTAPRVLPQVDVKSEYGYIVVADGTDAERQWLDWNASVALATPELLGWLQERRTKLGHRAGKGGGGLLSDEEYRVALKDGAKAGAREPFFARLSFECRKSGMSDSVVEQTLRAHWERCEQPPGDYFHWQYVEYKMIRDRHIRPDVTSAQLRWAKTIGSNAGQSSAFVVVDEAKPYRKVGRVTIAKREPRDR